MKISEKKIWLFGVFSACPLKYPLDDCVFKDFRKLSSLERWEFIDKLSEAEVDEYINYHRECIYKREMGNKNFCRSFNKVNKTG